jgi:uncharacterized protein YbaP (TraB family)
MSLSLICQLIMRIKQRCFPADGHRLKIQRADQHRVMQGLPRLLCLGVLTLTTSTLAIGETSVWQVRSGDNTVYLGGTVHLLRASDYPLPTEFEQAYAASSKVYFETDISAMNDMAVQVQMLQQLMYNDERSLKTVLNTEAYEALSAHTAKVGLPLMMLEKMKPGMVVSTLQVMEFQRMGFTPEGVDMHFNTKAVADGKAIGQFETLQEQIGFLAAMGEGDESEFILVSLQELEETDTMMQDMINAWRSGDAEALSDLFVASMREEAPALYDSLLLSRNLRWLPEIEALLTDSLTEFVLVGAAHLVGEQGLLQLLASKGYAVSQL